MISGAKEEGTYAVKSLEQRLLEYSPSTRATLALFAVTFGLKLDHAAMDRIERLRGGYNEHELLAALRG